MLSGRARAPGWKGPEEEGVRFSRCMSGFKGCGDIERISGERHFRDIRGGRGKKEMGAWREGRREGGREAESLRGKERD